MPKRMATLRMDDDPLIRRSFISPDQLLTRPDGDLITTVSDIFPYAVSLGLVFHRGNELS